MKKGKEKKALVSNSHDNNNVIVNKKYFLDVAAAITITSKCELYIYGICK